MTLEDLKEFFFLRDLIQDKRHEFICMHLGKLESQIELVTKLLQEKGK